MNSALAIIASVAAFMPDCSATLKVARDRERALQQIVVERAEKLRDEEWCEPSRGE